VTYAVPNAIFVLSGNIVASMLISSCNLTSRFLISSVFMKEVCGIFCRRILRHLRYGKV
jgi:hypothetical protein